MFKERNLIIILLTILQFSKCIVGACDDFFEWTCGNGECIDRYDVCNGIRNCKDGSDETADICIANECPRYAYRCTYGACIPDKRKCDGSIDCEDGSDEAVLLCGNETAIDAFMQKYWGDCKRNTQLKCLSGECIENHFACDGVRQCADGSDESIELCSTVECPAYSFRCGYGGCIKGTGKCNKLNECWDGSDESYALCDDTAGIRTAPILTTTTTTSTIPQNGECKLPYSKYLVVKNPVRNEVIRTSFIKNYTPVTYECTEGAFFSSDVRHGYCVNGVMSSITPSCIKKCETIEVTRDFSTYAICDNEGNGSFDCRDIRYVAPKTRATFKCSTFFSAERELPALTCLSDGTWNGNPPICNMLCGSTVNTTQLSKDGIIAYKSEIPWHVTLFSNATEIMFDYKCGASVISPIIVLSAAHCAYDNTIKRADLPENYVIVPEFPKARFDLNEKSIDYYYVSKILTQSSYSHDDTLKADLALFVLQKPFEFSRTLRPICLKFFENSGKEVPSNVVGQLGALDSNLTKMALTLISGTQYSFNDCKTTKVASSIVDDKFCVKLSYGRACQGDSGGGYYTRRGIRFYLTGVLSSADVYEDGCSKDYILLTNIQHYGAWIKDVITVEENNYRYPNQL